MNLSKFLWSFWWKKNRSQSFYSIPKPHNMMSFYIKDWQCGICYGHVSCWIESQRDQFTASGRDLKIRWWVKNRQYIFSKLHKCHNIKTHHSNWDIETSFTGKVSHFQCLSNSLECSVYHINGLVQSYWSILFSVPSRKGKWFRCRSICFR